MRHDRGMALRIGGVPVLFAPSEVVGGVRAVLGWTDEAIELVADLPARVDRLMVDVETLVKQLGVLIERVERVATSAETVVMEATAVTTAAQDVVGRTTATVAKADAAVAGAAAAMAEASGLMAVYQPIAERAAPLARQFVEEFSEAELHAAIRLVDTIPKLSEHVEKDVLPLLATLDRIGPDMEELLGVVKDVRSAVSSLPGLRMLRRRPEDK